MTGRVPAGGVNQQTLLPTKLLDAYDRVVELVSCEGLESIGCRKTQV